MGVRLYNPTTGRFLTLDPIPGGNDSPYTYPADPINAYDLDGKAIWFAAAAACIRFCRHIARGGQAIWRNRHAISNGARAAWNGARRAGGAVRRTVRSAGRSCRANSFAADTKILMADGSHKAISDVQIGDLVVATDPATSYTANKPVTDVIIGEGPKDLVEVSVEAGPDGDIDIIVATASHPVYVLDAGWTDATDLRAGDRLSSTGGTTPHVTSVKKYMSVQTVYNLTVADIHTYYVAADESSALVHNCWRPPVRIQVSNMRSANRAVKKWTGILQRRGYTCSVRGRCGQGDLKHINWTKNGQRGTIHFGKKR